MNIGDWLTKRAMLSPDAASVISDDGRTYTYGEFDKRVNRLASALPGVGVNHGDRIAVLFPNNPEFLEILFGAAKIGAIMVPLNYRLTPPELAYIVNDCGATALAYTPDFVEQAGALKSMVKDVKTFIRVGEETEEDEIDYGRWVSQYPDTRPGVRKEVSPDDPHFIMYTSGTTGRPKGAILTHANTSWNAINAVLAYGLSQKDTNLISTPLYHIGGLSAGATPTIFSGGKVILNRFFQPDRTLRMIESHRVTIMFGIPTMFHMMAGSELFDDIDFSSVRFLIAGGAPCPVPLIEKYLAKGVTFNQGYGLTEAAPGVTALDDEDSLRKRGSAGKPLFFVDVDIVDDDNMEVPTGEIGEIVIKGPNVFKGYWNMPEETEQVIRYGWLHSGDLGYLDNEGYLYVKDRKKDMLISGGENVYPVEVENVLLAHPKVEEVAVIGMPDEKWGEAPLAIVVTKAAETLSEDELIEFCRDKLARFKTPRKVVFRESLPRNPTGKVLKRKLRAQFTES